MADHIGTLLPTRTDSPKRIFMLGATGTIGRATVAALVRRGHEVVCFVRPRQEVAAGDGHHNRHILLNNTVVQRLADKVLKKSVAENSANLLPVRLQHGAFHRYKLGLSLAQIET